MSTVRQWELCEFRGGHVDRHVVTCTYGYAHNMLSPNPPGIIWWIRPYPYPVEAKKCDK